MGVVLHPHGGRGGEQAGSAMSRDSGTPVTIFRPRAYLQPRPLWDWLIMPPWGREHQPDQAHAFRLPQAFSSPLPAAGPDPDHSGGK